jgi:DNA polymerase III subunit delta
VILQSLEELERELKNGLLRPVYLISGPEQYQCRAAVDMLKSSVLSAESAAFDYSEFSAGDALIDEILAAANTFPMVAERRLVLVTGVEKLKESEQEILLNSLKNLSSRCALILLATDLDHRKTFYRSLNEKYCAIECQKLKGIALEKWAETYIRQRGYGISASAIKRIVDLAGSDLQSLSVELEKLVLYAGNEKNIANSAIDDLVRSSRQHGIFELIDAISRKDRNSALKLLSNLLSMGEHPLVVVTMMARHCRQILIVKECLHQGKSNRETGTIAQIPAFILEQFIRQSRSADSTTVQEMYIRLADIDRMLKSSSADGHLLLENLICALV